MGYRKAWVALLMTLSPCGAFAQPFEYFDAPVNPAAPARHPDARFVEPQLPSQAFPGATFDVGSTIQNLRDMRTPSGNRTLILIDGRRAIETTDAGGGVDLSFVPSILMSRMEAVNAGAAVRSRPQPSSGAAGSAGVPIVQEATVPAPVGNVWRAWSTSTGLSAWLAPVATIDLRLGGSLRASHDGRGVDSDSAVVSEILAFEPQRMLSYRVTRTARNAPFVAAAHATWIVVDLEPAGDAATRVRITLNGLEAAAADARAFFERSNAEMLERLVQRFGATD